MDDVEASIQQHLEKSPGTDCCKLDLSSQDINKVPETLLQSRHLCHLLLDFNEITELPDVFGDCLQSLKFLSLEGNDLKCLPRSFGNLSNLQELFLNENDLIELTPSFGSLKNLKIINIVGNKIQKLPVSITELVSLYSLMADENNLSELPENIGDLKKLKLLEVSVNKLVELPPSIGQLTNLESLNVSSNKLNTLPDTLGDLENLKALDVSCNNINHLPCHFKSAMNLEMLSAENNEISDLPEWVSDLVCIESIALADNHIKGDPFTKEFAFTCKRLTKLDFGGNFMSKLPDSFGELASLEYLHFGSVIHELERRNFQNGNWLTTLPESFSHLYMLRELHLDENQLVELPEDFGNLHSLEFLDIGQNRIHELPASFGNLKTLRICLLSKNHIELLPTNFGHLSNLEDLRLDNNRVAELPETFHLLSNLKTLDLFNNMLSEIPSCVESLTKLIRLDLAENKFSLPLNTKPMLDKKLSYAPRNPELKDNWRGKGRQDEITVPIIEFKKEEGASEDESPEEQQAEWNENALRRAMMSSLSLWRSHGGPDKREVYKSNRRDSLSVSDHESEDDVSDDGDWQPWNVTSDDGGSTSDSVQKSGCIPLSEEEDWDKECEVDVVTNQQPIQPLFSCRYQQQDYVPSDDHVAKVAWTRPVNPPVIEGQFSDAEEDD